MKIRVALAGLAVLLIVSGCSTATVKPTSVAAPDQGYIYGRVQVTREKGSNPLGMAAIGDYFTAKDFTCTLELSNNATAKPVPLRFSTGTEIFVLAVPPGTYAVGRLMPLQRSWGLVSKRQPLTVEGGHAYYIGDLSFLTQNEYHGGNAVTYHYHLNPIVPNFEATTKDFKSRYPNFQSVPTALAWPHLQSQ